MTKTELIFNREMQFSRSMERVERARYWSGYRQGLMRGLFGAAAISNRLHEAMIHASGDVAEVATGYFKGLEMMTAVVADGEGSTANGQPSGRMHGSAV